METVHQYHHVEKFSEKNRRNRGIDHNLRSENREIEAPENFVKALNENPEAKAVFEQMSASKQLEIVRYLFRLKSEEVRNKNIERAINFLLGKERFVGRDKP